MLQDPAARGNGLGLLARADELLAASRADALADGSDLLPSGLTRRLASLAGALRAAVAGSPPADPDLPWVPADALAGVERAWIRGGHAPARGRRRADVGLPRRGAAGALAGREFRGRPGVPAGAGWAGTATATPGWTRPSATPPPG